MTDNETYWQGVWRRVKESDTRLQFAILFAFTASHEDVLLAKTVLGMICMFYLLSYLNYD